jgi:hypothetical protein
LIGWGIEHHEVVAGPVHLRKVDSHSSEE